MQRRDRHSNPPLLVGWIIALTLAGLGSPLTAEEESETAAATSGGQKKEAVLADPSEVKQRSLAANESFDLKYGLILPRWKINKIRSLLSPSNSPNLKIGLPPYRQQPEGMEQYPPIDVLQPPAPAPVATAKSGKSGPAPNSAPASGAAPPPNPNPNPPNPKPNP